MATDRQIAANRLNAQRSTGPTSEAGKARSRLNAVTHGLTGELDVLPLMASAPFVQRRQAWDDQFRPETPAAQYALDRAVVASFRIEQCEATFDAMVVDQATRARLAWDVDRRVATAILADKLSKKPALITTQLEETRHGCEWKIQTWTSLGQSLTDNGEWTEAQASIALDLLGVAPAFRTGKTAIDAPENGDRHAHQLAIVARETRQLLALNETTLIATDEHDRQQAEEASLALLSAPALRLHRYEREAWRRLNSSLKILKSRDLTETEVPIQKDVQSRTEIEMTPAQRLDDDIQRQEAVVACYDEAGRQFALTTTAEEREAVLDEMHKTAARIKDRSLPLHTTWGR